LQNFINKLKCSINSLPSQSQIFNFSVTISYEFKKLDYEPLNWHFKCQPKVKMNTVLGLNTEARLIDRYL